MYTDYGYATVDIKQFQEQMEKIGRESNEFKDKLSQYFLAQYEQLVTKQEEDDLSDPPISLDVNTTDKVIKADTVDEVVKAEEVEEEKKPDAEEEELKEKEPPNDQAAAASDIKPAEERKVAKVKEPAKNEDAKEDVK